MSDQTNETVDPQIPEGDAAEPQGTPAASATTGEAVDVAASEEQLTPERLGDLAVKFATETAYAAAGVADLVARSTKDFIDAQRKQLAERTPEGVDPNFKRFVDGMPDQFKAFMDEVTRAYHDMAERGRGAVADFQAQAQAPKPAKPEPTGAFDLQDDVEASDAESVIATDEPEVVIVEEILEEGQDDGAGQGETWPGESDEEQRS